MCMQLTDLSLADVKLWRDSVHSAYNFVRHGQPEVMIFKDASPHGWGVVLGGTTSKGVWSQSEAPQHINYLKMLAVYFALQAFQNHLEGKNMLE